MQISKQQHKAAEEMIELISAKLGENRAVHPATAIASCARLAGSFMFRSFDLQMKDINPGNVVLSEQANEKGPVLINVLGWVLSNLGVTIDQKELGETSNAAPNLNFLDSLHLLQNKAVIIMHQNKLSFEEMAYSCAMATAFIIKECQGELAVESGFNTAIYSFIEGSKTYPPPLSDPPKKKSIFTFWK